MTTNEAKPSNIRAMSPIARLPVFLRVLHVVILANFVLNVLYASYMVFFVLRPAGVSGPLLGAASSVPIELMVTRRLYANEFWVSCTGLSLYVAVTEMLPRMLARPTPPS